MLKEREERYRQKLQFVASRTSEIPLVIDSPLAVDATLYRLQTAIDACMDVIAMLVRDMGHDVADDYANIHTLEKAKVFDRKLGSDMAMLNGLRNAIVHKYNSFEEATVIEEIESIKEILLRAVKKVEDETNGIAKKTAKKHSKRP